MSLRSFKANLRKVLPYRLYPVLFAPIHRRHRRRAIRQMEAEDARYREEHPAISFPDAELRFNVCGECTAAGFLSDGRRTTDDLAAALNAVGVKPESIQTGLDFGCGCGRLLIAASQRWPQLRWTGSDVDARAVQWCAEHLAGVSAVVNGHMPPLPFRDGEFDLIWCGSVFTHLDEGRQDAWLAELRRVLAPGGCLVASVHGPKCWEVLDVSDRVLRRIQEKGLLFVRTGFDEGVHPDWYQVAFHTQEYIEQHWSRFVEVGAYLPTGLGEYQDLVVGRKPIEPGKH